MKKITILASVATLLTLASCKKDQSGPSDQKPESMDQLIVPDSFNWKTTRNFQLTIQAASQGIVEVNSVAGPSFQKAYLQPGQAYVMQLTVPAYEKNVKLRFAGQEVLLQLDGNTNLTYSFQ